MPSPSLPLSIGPLVRNWAKAWQAPLFRVASIINKPIEGDANPSIPTQRCYRVCSARYEVSKLVQVRGTSSYVMVGERQFHGITNGWVAITEENNLIYEFGLGRLTRNLKAVKVPSCDCGTSAHRRSIYRRPHSPSSRPLNTNHVPDSLQCFVLLDVHILVQLSIGPQCHP